MKSHPANKTAVRNNFKERDNEILEQRSGKDRRQKIIPPLRFLLFGGRRKNIRREEDMQNIVIMDSYSRSLFAVIIVILFLSLIDAAMTLYLIGHGAKELNPLMDYFLQKSPLTFIIAKYFITSVALIIILLIKNTYLPRTRFRSKNLFIFAIISFTLVIIWEIWLFYMVVFGSV
ncbi:MAG: DUF5658 family protein [Desulfobacterales bacterium]